MDAKIALLQQRLEMLLKQPMPTLNANADRGRLEGHMPWNTPDEAEYDLDSAATTRMDEAASSKNTQASHGKSQAASQPDMAAAKRRPSKEARRERTLLKRKAWRASLNQACQLLGLETRSSNLHLPEEPILVSIDTECYERDNTKLTEVGLAFLDTGSTRKTSSGPNGDNWVQHMACRHFRIRENARLLNHEFCTGAASNFEHGETEFIPIQDLEAALIACLSPPYQGIAFKASTPGVSNDSAKDLRPIVLVGHGVSNDLRNLQYVGIDLEKILSNRNRQHGFFAIDTTCMAQAYLRESNQRALGKLAGDLDLPPDHMHNAGNDAWVTLRVMIALALRKAAQRKSRQAETLQKLEEGCEADGVELKGAVGHKHGDDEGWSSSDDECKASG